MNKAPTEREGGREREREREREQTNLKEMRALLEEVLHCCFGPDLGFVFFFFCTRSWICLLQFSDFLFPFLFFTFLFFFFSFFFFFFFLGASRKTKQTNKKQKKNTCYSFKALLSVIL
jgi:hypothetical protein